MYCMDTMNDCTIPHCGIPREKCVVGMKQLKKALMANRATQVFLAQNADPALTEPLESLCQEKQVPCVWVDSMEELGRACGIEVGAAAAAIVE